MGLPGRAPRRSPRFSLASSFALVAAVIAALAWGCGTTPSDSDSSESHRARELARIAAAAAAEVDGGDAAATVPTEDASASGEAGTGGACTLDSNCVVTDYCSSLGTCQPRLGTGGVCQVTAGGDCRVPGCRECQSGDCDNGICCGTSSCPSCESCSAALQQPFADGGVPGNGTCAPVLAGTDPYDSCTAPSNPDSCQGTGLCNGAGACQVPSPSGSTCGAPACSGNDVTTPLCNATGTCTPSSLPCAPYACENGKCATACATSADCTSPATCNLGTCGTTSPVGTTCDLGTDCATGICADGVCCNSACTGQCQACDNAGNLGSCSAVTGAPHSGHTPCVGDDDGGGACTGVCDGTNTQACAFPGDTTTCGGTCTGNTFSSGVCHGDGTCVNFVGSPCQENFACQSGGGACGTSCTSNAGCARNFACSAGKCISAFAVCVGSDLNTSLDGEDAGVIACAPYACEQDAGECATTCTTSSDCASGYDCNGGKCGTTSGKSGCSCDVVGSRGGSNGPWALAIVLGSAIVARRRRAKRAPTTPLAPPTSS